MPESFSYLCFPVNFAKLLITPLENGTEHFQAQEIDPEAATEGVL